MPVTIPTMTKTVMAQIEVGTSRDKPQIVAIGMYKLQAEYGTKRYPMKI
jgi:hypothetical protein